MYIYSDREIHVYHLVDEVLSLSFNVFDVYLFEVYCCYIGTSLCFLRLVRAKARATSHTLSELDSISLFVHSIYAYVLIM